MNVKLLTEHNLEFLCLKGAAQARPSLHMSKCDIVGNHMSRLKCFEQCIIIIIKTLNIKIIPN